MYVCMYVCMFVGCCLATKSLSLNNTSRMGGGGKLHSPDGMRGKWEVGSSLEIKLRGLGLSCRCSEKTCTKMLSSTYYARHFKNKNFCFSKLLGCYSVGLSFSW